MSKRKNVDDDLCFECAGEIVLCQTKAEIDRAIERIYEWILESEKEEKGLSRACGFDMEWRVLYKKGQREQKTSMIQIAVSDFCVLIRLNKLKDFRPTRKLIEFVEDEQVLKCGVNVRGDAQKLMRDFKVQMVGVCELDSLAKAKIECSSSSGSGSRSEEYPALDDDDESRRRQERRQKHHQRWSLERLCNHVLKKRLLKDGNTRTGNWERGDLTDKQLRYAAIDAIVGLEIWHALNQKKDVVDGVSYESDPLPEGFVPRKRILDGEYDPEEDDEDDDDDDDYDDDERYVYDYECENEQDRAYSALREAALTTLDKNPTTTSMMSPSKMELTRGAKKKNPIEEDVEEVLIQHLGGKTIDSIALSLDCTIAEASKKLTIAIKAGHAYYWDLLDVSNDVWFTFLQSREEGTLSKIREVLPRGAEDMPKILFCAVRFAREKLHAENGLEGDESESESDEESDSEEEEEEE